MGESRGVTTWLGEIRAGWPALLLSLLACCGLAAIATVGQPSLYGAKGAVVLSPERFLQSEGTDALPALTENVVRLSSTEAVLIPASRAFAQAGDDFAERTSRQRTATLSWLRDHIRVEKVGTSSVVEVTGRASTQEAAIDLTRSAVESLTRFVRDTRGDATGEPAPPSGLIILSAAEAEGQVSPTPLRNFFVAINAGVLLGLLLALGFGRSRLRGDARQLASHLGVPLLTAQQGRRGNEEAVTAAQRLLESLQSRHAGSLVVLLTGPADSDSIAHAAKRLGAAICLATGKRALLVDADLGERAMSWQLRLADRPGLSDLMTSDVDARDLEESIVPLYGPNEESGALSVLPAGPPGPTPINQRRIAALVEQLDEAFHFVIVTGPSVDKTSDLLALVSAAHYCLLVTDGSISPQRLEGARVLRQDARPGAMGLISIHAPRRWLPQRS